MPGYQLLENGQFEIVDYQNARPFASFLPGIAGPMGIPLWVFYVNRGQAIASFGVENKDKPILEYQTANRAYQLTSYLGFRTFIKITRENRPEWYEPFSRGSPLQRMLIGGNELVLQEENSEQGLRTDIIYFLLPGENLAGLVRLVTVTNISDRPVSLEILDGLPALIPFGVNNQILKDIGRTVEAWMEVYNLEQNVPFYRLRASVADTAEVSSFEAGQYMLAFQDGLEGVRILPAIVDPALVFGQNTALSSPDEFSKERLAGLLARKQITCGRTPCGFSGLQVELIPGASARVNSIFGHASRLENIQSAIEVLTSPNFLDKKRTEANQIVHSLTDPMACRTGFPAFDAYCRQTLLDNILRGGWPETFGTGKIKSVFHIYSRKHGDLERDYNAFSLAPEFYSQGNGSYRDINQNRREDVWLNPDVGDFNIRTFMSLIQLDGYNPLVLQGSRFTVPAEKLDGLLNLADNPERLREYLSRPFSPGNLLKAISDQAVKLKIGMQAFLEKVLTVGTQHIETTFGEGYWVDHWMYNLDLIESYLSVYPDNRHELLFSAEDLPYHDSPVIVQPRSRKYVLLDGQPRQLDCLIEDRKKGDLIVSRGVDAGWVRVNQGTGAIYRTSLFAKLFSLATIKFATLDPCGLGIEMEAGRPGWYDALNGLPGLFGSSLPETYALRRLTSFLLNVLKEEKPGSLRLPVELVRFLRRIVKENQHYHSNGADECDYIYWDHVSSAREAYRASTRFGLDGAEESLSFAELVPILNIFETKLDEGIQRALTLNHGIPATYFMYRVDEFELIKDNKDRQQVDRNGRPTIRAKGFTPQPLPLFLEGMVRAMHGLDTGLSRQLYQQIRNSPLYDRKLKMYKVNAALDSLPKDIGRARAFTPGWLENESIWLHMEYKYLLEVLRAGLYEEFFEDFKAALIPFLDPAIYGRSILENSSFLVSSAHPDESLQGAGFVARLSGATAEFISMWRTMMAGEQPFTDKEGQLCLAFKPVLPGWLFCEDNTVTCKFLGKTTLIYHNPKLRNTFEPECAVQSIILHPLESGAIELTGNVIPAPYALMVRNSQVRQIDVYFA
jgi:hypothetical protein